MVQQHGGVAAAKRLLFSPVAQSGLTKLWERERLDISMEALVVQERWKPLFSDAERQTARERLQAFGYQLPPGTDDSRAVPWRLQSLVPLGTQFDGRYRTKDLILAYMNAPAAGDTETPLAV